MKEVSNLVLLKFIDIQILEINKCLEHLTKEQELLKILSKYVAFKNFQINNVLEKLNFMNKMVNNKEELWEGERLDRHMMKLRNLEVE